MMSGRRIDLSTTDASVHYGGRYLIVTVRIWVLGSILSFISDGL